MTISNIKPRLFDSLEGFANLQKEWEDLSLKMDESSIFLEWAWINVWLSHYPSDLWIIAFYSDDKLVGLAPWMRTTKVFGLRHVQFIGTGFVQPDHLDVLAEKGFEAAVSQSIVKFLDQHSCEWDILDLHGLRANSLLINELNSAWSSVQRDDIPCPVIPLQDITDWDDFQKQRLSAHMRKKGLRYLQNLLQRERGALNFERVSDDDETIQYALSELVRSHRDRWAKKETFTPFENDTFIQFHQTMAITAAKRGWLGLYRLRVADTTIATVYGFHHKNKFYDYQHGLDNEWSKYSPGRQLIAYIIQSCIKDKYVEYDFLSGNESYKFSWTQIVRYNKSLLWHNGLRGRLWCHAIQAKQYLKRIKRSLTKQKEAS